MGEGQVVEVGGGWYASGRADVKGRGEGDGERGMFWWWEYRVRAGRADARRGGGEGMAW